MRTTRIADRLRIATVSVTLAGSICAVMTSAGAAPPDDLSPRKSRFTAIDLKSCKQTQRHRDGGTWLCDGFAGMPVSIAEGDARFFMSFGATPLKRRAATQTLSSFNTIFEGAKSRVTVEWRTLRRGGRERPYAAIVRYFTSQDDRARGQVLVVTHISERQTCHMAYIDALANPEPVALARSVADELAEKFDCRTDPRTVGVTGKSPM